MNASESPIPSSTLPSISQAIESVVIILALVGATVLPLVFA